ncbi:MAG: VanZ family protein [Myxococcales bacterium]|nr:VanZ family protein [Myxococcales bacterium]
MSLQRFWWGFGILLVALAILVCLVPGRELPHSLEWNDKLSHLAGHGALALYFSGLVVRRNWWKLFVWLFALGVAIEFAQVVLPTGREGDVRDVIANASGTGLGLLLGWMGLAHWPQWAAWLLGRRTA